jgi:hypothetical protein
MHTNLLTRASRRPRSVVLGASACLVVGASILATSCLIVRSSEVDLYDACVWDADCPGSSVCHSVTVERGGLTVTNHMCTFRCVDDADCPGYSICEGSHYAEPLCFQRCTIDDDCGREFVCSDGALGYARSPPICLPW